MKTIYEVIRVIGRHPIFLAEHLERMKHSLAFYKSQALDEVGLRRRVAEICRHYETDDFNIRLECDVETLEYRAQALEGHYPCAQTQAQGVVLATYPYRRTNPNVKALDYDLRRRMDDLKAEKGAFELLYVDGRRVLEGTKSNIFFIGGDHLVTAPDSEVLRGITRQKVIETAREEAIAIERRAVYIEELAGFDGAFLTGTSIHFLPIRKIDDINYPVNHPIWQRLISRFQQKLISEQKQEIE